MTAAVDAIRDFVTPLLPGWVVQSFFWEDQGGDKSYCVIKPAGGLPAELVRRPALTLSLIGPAGGDQTETGAVADTLIEAMRLSSGDLVFIQPAEPVYMPTADRRPVFEIAIAAIST